MSTLLTAAIIMGLTALFSLLNERLLGLQQTIGLVVIALACTVVLILLNAAGIADHFTTVRSFIAGFALNETLLNGVLCFILFSGSINVKSATLREERWVIVALAIGATLIATVLIGVAVWGVLALFGVSLALIYALVFGALISPTDPIAALAILSKVGLPPRLEAIINGESLFNDGVGVVLFTICLSVAAGAQQPTAWDAIVLFLREVLGGIALGLGASAVMHAMMARTRDYGTQVLTSLAVVALAYATSEHIDVSGPIAMVVTGLVIGNHILPREDVGERRRFETFWEAIDQILNAMLFVLIGLHLALIPMGEPLLWTATITVVVCLIARWVSVYLSLRGLTKVGALRAQTLGLTNLLTWGGLRGGLAVAMALSLPAGPEKGLILHMTYGVVIFSIIVQGLTIARLFKADYLKSLLADT